MSHSLRLLLAAALLAFAGCSTIESRIREKAAVFDQIPPADQARIRQGIIAIGFTPDMVYMALGQPDRIRERTNRGGRETVWRYVAYYQRYEGTYPVRNRRFVYWDPRLQAYRFYYEPGYASVYSERPETYNRVAFRDGRVTVIEQTKQ
ncbi:MAG TPA: hypothetical protein VLT83_07610 [Opitutaceae bacterium]|nr:hypothetical protein [Opitutaceae bacterium]